MKKYVTPEIELNVIFTHDIMSLSTNTGDAAENNEIKVSLSDGFWG